MTDRRRLLGGLALSVLAAPLVAKAQQAAKVSRIGYLSSHSPENFGLKRFGKGCMSSAGSRAGTSSSNTGLRTGTSIGFLFWQPSWSGSR